MLSTEESLYDADELHDTSQNLLLGVEFKSTEKIKRHKGIRCLEEKPTTDVSKDIFLDVECSLIDTTRIGSMHSAAKAMDIVHVNGHENVNPKYLQLETNYIPKLYI